MDQNIVGYEKTTKNMVKEKSLILLENQKKVNGKKDYYKVLNYYWIKIKHFLDLKIRIKDKDSHYYQNLIIGNKER